MIHAFQGANKQYLQLLTSRTGTPEHKTGQSRVRIKGGDFGRSGSHLPLTVCLRPVPRSSCVEDANGRQRNLMFLAQTGTRPRPRRERLDNIIAITAPIIDDLPPEYGIVAYPTMCGGCIQDMIVSAFTKVHVLVTLWCVW